MKSARDSIRPATQAASPTRASSVVCSSLAIAQGMVQALGLRDVRVHRSAGDAVAHWRGHPPRLVIFIGFDPAVLAAGVQLVKRRWPQARTLVVGLPNQEESILGSVAAGADGIVIGEESFDQLAQALSAVRAGSFRPPPTLIRPLFERLIQLNLQGRQVGADLRLAHLSMRERDIVTLLAQGKRNKEIACELSVEQQTIKNHLGRIFRKLNVHTRAAVAGVWGGSHDELERAT